MELWSRRKFFLTSLAGSAVASAGKLFGRTLANNTVLALARSGAGTIGVWPTVAGSPGQMDLLLDVNGYFQ